LAGVILAVVSENLDLVRSIYADWERGDFSRNEWADPEIDFGFVAGPDPGSWTGVAGMSARWREWVNAWRDFRAVPEEYLELDGERVLVLVQNRGRGRTSGYELVQESVANLFELRSGRVTRLVVYFDRQRAFADLDLSPRREP
jgi:ketosteroid isomerase-like protein